MDRQRLLINGKPRIELARSANASMQVKTDKHFLQCSVLSADLDRQIPGFLTTLEPGEGAGSQTYSDLLQAKSIGQRRIPTQPLLQGAGIRVSRSGALVIGCYIAGTAAPCE
jgi:hypothetical protein